MTHDNGMDASPGWQELKGERDVAIDQVAYWRERALEAEGERDALAAHVERLRQRLEDTASVIHFDSETDRLNTEVLSETSAISLARLKTEWQKEVLDELCTWMLEKCSVCDVLDIERFRHERQAEEGGE